MSKIDMWSTTDDMWSTTDDGHDEDSAGEAEDHERDQDVETSGEGS